MFQLVDSTNEPTVCKVLKCIVDLLCVHGAKVFDDGTESVEASRNRSKHSINTTTMDFEGKYYLLYECLYIIAKESFILSKNHNEISQSKPLPYTLFSMKLFIYICC